MTPGVTRYASSGRARSRSQRCGRWPSSANRCPRACARRWSPHARAAKAKRHSCRGPNRTSRSEWWALSRCCACCRWGYCWGSSPRAAGWGVAWLVISGVLYIAIMSFLVSAVCGYMAGLIGSSNSPLSGIGILAAIGFALILVFGLRVDMSGDLGRALVAYTLFVTAVVFTAAAIANNNLQDLKTGQLVDATPWKQQVALVIGVLAGGAIIPPILDLLNQAYGFAGAPGGHHEHPLPAPQAGLISALAQGVIQNNVDWSLIETGGLIGVIVIGVDALLRKLKPGTHLSPLAVGLGIYLPTQSTLMVVVGAVAGWVFDRNAERRAKPEATKQLGVLLASGMIVGEGLIGVLVAALVAFSGRDFPLALVGNSFATSGAIWLGGIAFALVIYALYRRVSRALIG